MSLDRFWQTLEELIGCADSRHGWSDALAGEFDQVSFLLRGTGTRAPSIKCPSGGGECCPRQVRPDIDGTFVAVCGNRPAQCHELKLSLDEVTVYALDVARLASCLGNALCLRTGRAPQVRQPRPSALMISGKTNQVDWPIRYQGADTVAQEAPSRDEHGKGDIM